MGKWTLVSTDGDTGMADPPKPNITPQSPHTDPNEEIDKEIKPVFLPDVAPHTVEEQVVEWWDDFNAFPLSSRPKDKLLALINKQVIQGRLDELKLIQQTGKDHDLAGAVKWLLEDRIAELEGK